jgi:DNA modification methylase
MPRKPNAIPGGGKMPIERMKDRDKAKNFGQELMRGEFTNVALNGRGKVSNATPGGSKMPSCSYSIDHARGDGAEKSVTEEASGTSIFDPVLCELAYRWFCPANGKILDPFAGGSVRGIVANKLGRTYTGIELRPEQIEANRIQALNLCGENQPVWIEGDSQHAKSLALGEYDFVFSCPPYADLEVYSEDPRDLSTMPYSEFLTVYRKIIAACCDMLKPDRFACFVVGDVRDKKGNYYKFPWHTIEAFQNAGLSLYNEAVLVTAVGSLPIRAGKIFESGRKLGKTHQNVLVFVKGDAKKATQAIGPVEFGAIEETRLGEESYQELSAEV